MAAPKRTKVQRENDLVLISELYLKGKTQAEIAEVLKLDQSQISYDLATLRTRWAAQTVYNLDQLKAQELEKIDTVERTYWQGWERSLQERTKTRQYVDKEKAKATIEKETAVGDPRFLDGVLKCIERRCKILGIDAPAEVSLDWRKEAMNAGFDPGALFGELAQIFAQALAGSDPTTSDGTGAALAG